MAITNLPFALYCGTSKTMLEATETDREKLKKACYSIAPYVLKLWNEYHLSKELEDGGKLAGDAHRADMIAAYDALSAAYPTPDATPDYGDYFCLKADEALAAEAAKTAWHDAAALAKATHWVYYAVFESHISFHEASFQQTLDMGLFHKLGRTDPEPVVVKFENLPAANVVAMKDGAEMDLDAAVAAVQGGAKDICFKATGLDLSTGTAL